MVFSGSIAAGVQVPAGATVAVTVDGSTQSATIESGGAFSATFTGLAGLEAAGSPYPVVYAFSSEGIFAAASQTTELTVTLATPTVAVADAGGMYNGSAFAASATVAGIVPGVDNTPAASLEGVAPSLTYYVGTYSSVGQLTGLTPLTGAPSGVGAYTVLASFPGSADYAAATTMADFIVTPATPTVAVADASGAYTGTAFIASATVTGVSGSAGATLEGVAPSLSYYAGTYTSVGQLTGLTPMSGAPIALGNYTVLADFVGSGDYVAATAMADFSISQATPTLAVSDTSGAYTGTAFVASATITGVSGNPGATLEGVSLSLTYYAGTYSNVSQLTGLTAMSSTPVQPGAYTVLASFPGSTDYTAATALASFTIAPASPTINLSDPGGTFSGTAFVATLTVAGVSGSAGASLEGVAPSLSYYAGTYSSPAQLAGLTALTGAPSGAGAYTVLASFAGSADYAAATALVDFSIAQATPTVALADASGTYSGTAFVASATITGVSGNAGATLEGVALSLTYYAGTYTSAGQLAGVTALSGAPTAVGSYTVLADFVGSADYASATALVDFSIAQATPTVGVVDAGGTYTGTAFVATATVAGVSGSAGASLEGVAPSLIYYSGTYTIALQLSGVTPLSGAPSGAGAYTVLASFAGSADYTVASVLANFRIAQATPTVAAVDAGGTYSGTAFIASATVTGVNGLAGSTLEGVAPTLTYYVGTYSSVSQLSGQTALTGAPAGVGAYAVLASFGGSTDYVSATALTDFDITPATPTVVVVDAGGTYSGTAFGASVTVTGVSGLAGATLEGVAPSLSYYVGTYSNVSQLSGLTAMSGTPVQAGSYTVLASFAGSTDYASATAMANFSIGRATPTIGLSAPGGTYSGTAFLATATVAGVSGSAGASLEGVAPSLSYYVGTYTIVAQLTGLTPLSGAPIGAGSYTVLASFAGSTDYAAASVLANFQIAQATPTVAVADAGGTYSGAAFGASATVTGVSGNAGSTLEGIAPSPSYYVGTYSSPAQLTGLTPLTGAPSGAGAYTVLASFAGSTDYASATAMADFSIGRATPTVKVSDASETYSGTAFVASATVAGVSGSAGANLEGVSPSLSYYAGTYTGVGQLTGLSALAGAPSGVGAYTVLAAFPGSSDYVAATALANFSISRATPTVSVNAPGGTYDGTAFVASATVAGASGPPGASLEGVSPSLSYYAGTYTSVSQLTGLTALSGAPTGAGTYTALASFAGSADYTAATGLANFGIAQATPTVSATEAGGTYSGTAFVASATVAGVSGLPGASLEGVTLSLSDYAGTYTSVGQLTGLSAMSGAPVGAGSYTVLADFAGSADYTAATGLVDFVVSPATPTVAVVDAGGTYDGQAFGADATVAGVVGGSGPSLEGVSLTVSYYSGTTTSGTPMAGVPTGAGTYTVLASFPGSADYRSNTASATFRIAPVTPTVAVSDPGGTYSGTPSVASATVTGLSGPAGASLEGVAPSLSYYVGTYSVVGQLTGLTALSGAPSGAGAYTILASFPGSADYTVATAIATFSISQAMPTVAVADAGGTYIGTAFIALATVTGVSGSAGANLEGVTPSLSYYDGTYTSVSQLTGLTALSGAPSGIGAYTVLASFPGSSDYVSATGLANFGIAPATPTVSVNDPGGAYSGTARVASVTVAGASGSPGASLEGVAPSLTYYAGTYTSAAQLSGLTAMSGAPIQPGSYTVLADFAGSADYTAATGLADFRITPATPTLDVVDAGGTYDGQTFGADATVAGVGGGPGSSLEGASLTVSYYSGTTAGGTPMAGVPTAAGTYTVLASFPGSADYAATSAQVHFTITPATPTVVVVDAGGTYSGTAFGASATVTGVSGLAGTTLEGVAPSLTYYAGTYSTTAQLTGLTALPAAPAAAGAYTVLASFPGSTDYAAAAALASFHIDQITPTVTWNAPAAITYGTGLSTSQLDATASVPGLFSYSPAAGAILGAGEPTLSVIFTPNDATDYSPVTLTTGITVARATPTVSVSDGGGTYNGAPFAATADVVGIGNQSGPSLEGVSPTLSYYAGSSTTGTPMAGAPSAVGTYTVVAVFPGSSDYATAQSAGHLRDHRSPRDHRVLDDRGPDVIGRIDRLRTVGHIGRRRDAHQPRRRDPDGHGHLLRRQHGAGRGHARWLGPGDPDGQQPGPRRPLDHGRLWRRHRIPRGPVRGGLAVGHPGRDRGRPGAARRPEEEESRLADPDGPGRAAGTRRRRSHRRRHLQDQEEDAGHGRPRRRSGDAAGQIQQRLEQADHRHLRRRRRFPVLHPRLDQTDVPVTRPARPSPGPKSRPDRPRRARFRKNLDNLIGMSRRAPNSSGAREESRKGEAPSEPDRGTGFQPVSGRPRARCPCHGCVRRSKQVTANRVG